MTPTPEIQPLSRKHRRFIFVLTIILFVTVVPALVFYAIGYRIDLSGETGNIRTVGGMYISADAKDVAIYIDDEPVEDMRIFQNAAYIQNLDAGLHQVHVQGEGIQTWVKTLPVQAHFVTEAASFNLPTTTQIRLVTEFLTTDGKSVVSIGATSTFKKSSTTNDFYATSTAATSSYVVNPEFVYLSTLFASSTEEREKRERQAELEAEKFTFSRATNTATSSSQLATTTKIANDVELRKEGDDVVAVWTGRDNNIPYYFCLTYTGPMATALAYGSHVYDDLVDEFASTTDLLSKELIGQQMCRSSIKIDRKQQFVRYFDFVPGNQDLVLLQLQDGVYVVEIDDRAWQNVQLLYQGGNLEVIVDSGSIFIKDGDMIMEVYTGLQA